MSTARILALVLGFFAALLQVAVVAAWPAPFGRLLLPLLLITALIGVFRFEQALLVAVAAGLTLDLLIGTVWGSQPLALLLTTGLLFVMFIRVITNVSVVSFVALNAIGYLLLTGLNWVARAFTDSLHGLTLPHGGTWSDWAFGLAAQVMLAAACLMTTRFIGDRLMRRFFLTRHASR